MSGRKKLPKGWRWAKLGDEVVAEIVMGQSPPGHTYNTNGDGLPFYQGKTDFGVQSPTHRVWCNVPKKIAKPEDILLSVRAPVGPTNVADEECCIGRGLAAIRGRDQALTEYLYFYMKHIEPWLCGQGAGSTFTAIGKKKIEAIEIPLPPLAEQERIVEVLQQADAIRRKRTEARRLADQILPALFLDMFGDPATNPKKWPVRKIGDCTTLVTSGYTPRGGAQNYIEEGPLLIRSQNVRMLALDLRGCAHLPEEIFHAMERVRVLPHDVLLNITGASIGRTAFLDEDIPPAVVNQHVCIIRPHKDALAAEFLSYLLSMPLYQHIIQNSPGSAQSGFNHQRVRDLDIPVPPMALQRSFGAHISYIQENFSGFAATDTISDALFSVLLSRAFTGELTTE